MIFYHTAADVPKVAPLLVDAAEPKPADGGGSAALSSNASAYFIEVEPDSSSSLIPASTPPLPSPPPPPPPPPLRAERVRPRASAHKGAFETGSRAALSKVHLIASADAVTRTHTLIQRCILLHLLISSFLLVSRSEGQFANRRPKM